MFDFGFSELLICGVVGLVVLGPERLPVVARTAGQWIGKAQRFVQQMKDDINRETELSELKKIKEDAEKIASDLNSSVQKAAEEIESEVGSVAGEAQKNLDEAGKAAESLQGELAGTTESEATAKADTDAVEDDSSGYDGEDFSDWDYSESETASDNSKIFEKRYVSGPSIDELAAEVEKLREKLAMGRHQFVGNNRKYAPRARSNRARIYR